MGQQNNQIDYIEFKTTNLEAVKAFYINAFGWVFTDYGPGYTSFEASRSGVSGGFEYSKIKTSFLIRKF
jgi:predicted enzyme related to lactoylglutathione lyase